MAGIINKNIQKSFGKNFELLCISLLVEGYNQALLEKKYLIDWKENTFTNHLATYMRASRLVQKHRIFVEVQSQPYNDNFPVEGTVNDADRQPIIDLKIANWVGSQINTYFIEAKNLCSSDWNKSDGAKVSASKQKRRYIKTGIENFRTKRYPKGCLTGYVLNSKAVDCVKGINKLLNKDKRESECLIKCEFLSHFKYSYKSIHLNKTELTNLKHIFLEFQ